MGKLFTYARILSLDVVLGALASGKLAAAWCGQAMPLSWWVALPVSVWVIYTTDHLLDAYRLGEAAHTARHRYHHRHFRRIAGLWGLLLLACVAWFPFWVPGPIRWFGLGMGGLVLGHLGLVWLIGDRISWLFHKELGVGLIYSAGVWGGPLALSYGHWPAGTAWLCGQFLLLALINLLVFSLYERDVDALDGHTSFVRAIGPRAAKGLVHLLALSVLALGAWQLWLQPWGLMAQVQGVYAAMLAVLWLLVWQPAWFAKGERYRAWGDGVFLLGGVVG